jgi:hypothetical protein
MAPEVRKSDMPQRYGVELMVNEEWRRENGKWKMENGKWLEYFTQEKRKWNCFLN